MQELDDDVKISILNDRKALLEHTDLIPDPRYPLFERTLLYLMKICFHFKPKRILDTGSGLTSILLRKYNPEALVVTVDNDDHWLDNTRKLFQRFDQDLYYEHIQSIMSDTVFRQYPWEEKFDLLVHDIGNMTLRLHSLPPFITYMNQKCVALFDNFGISPYKELAYSFLLSKGFVPLSHADPLSLTSRNAGEFVVFIREPQPAQLLYNRL